MSPRRAARRRSQALVAGALAVLLEHVERLADAALQLGGRLEKVQQLGVLHAVEHCAGAVERASGAARFVVRVRA